MNREKWAKIKNNKNYNVRIFRRGTSVIMVMLVFIFILQILILYFYLGQPEPDFYSTNGVTEPMKLRPLAAPNNTSVFLLAPDPPIVNFDRDLPQ